MRKTNRVIFACGIRVVLSASMLSGAAYFLAALRRMLVLRAGFSMSGSMFATGFVTFILIVLAWILIWHRTVRWNRTRKTGTAVIVPASLIAGIPLGIIIAAGDQDAGWALSALVPTGLFLIGTTSLWIPWELVPRRRHAVPAVSVPCPKCGYNLRGLTEARCPECGSQFTLDQLVIVKDSPCPECAEVPEAVKEAAG